jgi:iron uptake system component EfeO
MNRLIISLVAAASLTALAACASADAPTAPAAIPSSPALDAAVSEYQRYIKRQIEQLVTATDAFAADYRAGRDAAARAAYAPARVHWERVEPVAASFGELDPRLDLREAGLEPGQEWTGWHRIEKDLWPPASGYAPATQEEREFLATRLVADTAELRRLAGQVQLTPLDLSDGAKSLLDEIANGKITGEEEIWSHTDLWDFKANLDGAQAAYRALRPAVSDTDAELVATLDERFAATQEALAEHREGKGYRFYTELTDAEIAELAALVDALGEPLAQLSGAVSS